MHWLPNKRSRAVWGSEGGWGSSSLASISLKALKESAKLRLEMVCQALDGKGSKSTPLKTPGVAGSKGQKEQIIQISNIPPPPLQKENSKTFYLGKIIASPFKMSALEFWVHLSKTKTCFLKLYFREKKCIHPGMYIFLVSSSMRIVSHFL